MLISVLFRSLAVSLALAGMATAAVSVDVTPFNDGVAVTDNRTGEAYLMYSVESVFTRFSPAPHLANADHLVAVVYDPAAAQWSYDNNSALAPFAPASGDQILARLDLSADTAVVLVGTNESFRGIRRGVASTDLTITPNVWGGKSNPGEFAPAGTSFIPFDDPANAIPQASFVTSVAPGALPVTAIFDAADTTDDGAIISYTWDFGDGTSGSGISTSHDYSTIGVYVVHLTVTDDAGASDVISQEVYVADGALTSIGDVRNGVAATDGGVGAGYIMYSAQSVHDRFFPSPHPDNADHLIAVLYDEAAGVWLIDNNSTRRAFTPVGSDVLIATVDFSADTISGLIGINESVQGIRRGYLDGDLGFAANIWGGTSNAGEFQVTGTAFSLSPDAPDAVPVAVMLASPEQGSGPLSVSFDASASTDDGSIASYAWDFGDGATGSGVSTSHVFTKTGAYTVRLAVTDDSGAVGSTTQVVTVLPPNGALDIGILGNGVAATDNRTGTGFLMYSVESVHARFASAPHPYNANHVIAVVYDVGTNTWQYDNNLALHAFAPASTDVLIATVDFAADTIVSLQGQQGDENGIAKGYEVGDLVFTPNIWGGVANPGEFSIAGTYFTPWSVDPNTPPVATDGSVQVAYQGSVAIDLLVADDDADSLTYQIVDAPVKGSLSGTAPALTYTAQAGQSGADFFTFRANDGYEDSNLATVTIAILEPPNTPPTVDDQALTVESSSSLGIVLNGSDADSDPLTFIITGGPNDGVLTGTVPNLTYTPNGGFTGTDIITFLAHDGTEDSEPGTISITVTAPAVAPVAVLDRYAAATAGAAIVVDAASGVLANDQGLDPSAQAELVTDVSSGTLSLAADGSFSYQAPVDWRGTTQFSYRLSTSQGLSSAVMVYLAIGVAPTAKMSALTAATDFDEPAWLADPPGYAASYAADSAAGRVWAIKNGGAGVPIIQADGPRYLRAAKGSAVTLPVSVPAMASAPVNFLATGKGTFVGAGDPANAHTVVADSAGAVSGVQFTVPTLGRHIILVSSPVASGLVRFVVEGE